MPRRKPVDTGDVAEAVAAYKAERKPQGRRGKTSVLNPLEERFAEAVVLGAPSATAAAAIAGYSDPNAQGYQVAARPHVIAAIEDKRSRLQQDADVNIAAVWRELQSVALYRGDDWKDIASSKVRSAELLLRGAGELDTRVNVTIDQRSALLPAVDAGQAGAALERMFVDAGFVEAADGGTSDVAGG